MLLKKSKFDLFQTKYKTSLPKMSLVSDLKKKEKLFMKLDQIKLDIIGIANIRYLNPGQKILGGIKNWKLQLNDLPNIQLTKNILGACVNDAGFEKHRNVKKNVLSLAHQWIFADVGMMMMQTGMVKGNSAYRSYLNGTPFSNNPFTPLHINFLQIQKL